MPVLEVELAQIRGANRPPVIQQADDVVVPVAPLLLDRLVEPLLLHGLADGRSQGEVALDLRIRQPAGEQLQVAALGWAQVDPLAAQDRDGMNGWRLAVCHLSI